MQTCFRKNIVNTAVTLALTATPAAHAAVGDAVGSAFTVNTTSDTNAYPAVAMGAAGNFVVTWGGGSNVRARCYDSAGSALGDEVTVGSPAAGYVSAVDADAAGNSVVLWQDGTNEVYAQRLDSGCTLQGSVIDVGEASSGSTAKYYFDVAMAADGRFVVVWSYAGTTYAQRYDAEGAALGAVISVYSNSHSSSQLPNVSSRADGGFVVSLRSDNVNLRYYDADGNPQTDLITYNPPDYSVGRGVAVDGDGDVIATWKNYYDYQIYAQRFNASGDRVGGNLEAADDAAAAYSAGYYAEDPEVTADDDGDFIVVWDRYYGGSGIIAQRFDSADTKGGEVTVATSGSYPDVAMDADGDAVVVWDAGSNIKAQRYEGKSETVDVAVSGSADVATINVGNDVTYTWSITNNGSGTVLAVSLDDVLPTGLAYRSYNDSAADGWSCSDASGTVTCTLPRLVSGGSSSVELVLDTSALSGSSLDNSATGSTPMSDTDNSNDSATVTVSINNAPGFDTSPVVSGTAAVGNTLSVTTPSATDAEGDSFSVSYQWQADGADISGATSDSYTPTDSEAHAAITAVLTITDDSGAFSTATADGGTVANRPATFDATPSISGTAEVGNTLSVIDTATSDADGDVVSLSYQWQADGVAISGATADSYTLTEGEVHAVITVVVSANDGYDTTDITSSSVTVANRVPTFDATPSISGTALVGNTLSVIDTATSDADGDTVSLSYQWQANGVDISGATSGSYTLTSDEAHSTITVGVTADDGYGTTVITSGGVGVDNTAPVISSVGISGTASAGEAVTAIVGGKDVDGDSLSYSYEWYVDGTLVGTDADSYTIVSGDSGKIIFVIVTVSDGNGGSDSAASMAQYITNSAPSFDATPTISGSAYVGNTLSVSGVSATDPEGEAISYSYQWYANGVAISGANSDSYLLTASEAHSTITATVSASDGTDSTTITSSGVTVGNSSPVFTATPTLSGGTGVGDTLSVSGIAVSDNDDDTLSYEYEWYADGALISSATASSYTLTSDENGKSMVVIVKVSDGYGGSDSSPTSVISVTNTDPVISGSPTISGSAVVGGSLSVSGFTTADSDGDSLTVSYQWQADGVDISGATASSYTLTSNEAHKSLTVVVTAADDFGGSDSATSAGVSVSNSAPTFDATPTIIGSSQIGDSVAVINTDTSDADGDTVTLGYQWQADGVDISGATANSYTLTSDEAHKSLSVIITASDGNGGSASVTSSSVSVGNNSPVFNSTPGISGSAYVGGTLSVSGVSASDADGDSLGYLYQWRSNGTAISGATSSSYTLTVDEAHSAITVTVTATDSNGGSAAITSHSVTVQNSTPVFAATPVLSGTPEVGESITVGSLAISDADGDSPSYAYQWYVGGSLVGSDSSYTLQSDDVGKSVTAIIFASDGYGALINAIASGMTVTNNAPTFDGTPAISGTGAVGELLTLIDTTASDADGNSVTLSYQWYVDGSAISGATADSYTVADGDAGSDITAVVSVSDGYGGMSSATTGALGVAVSSSTGTSSSGGGGAFSWLGLLFGLLAVRRRRSLAPSRESL